jgi:arsenate reductase
MQSLGDDLGQFDLIVALSAASQRMALELTQHYHLTVEHWPIMDPSALGEGREAKLSAYRQARDQIRAQMLARFGPPSEAAAQGRD